ncbi:COG3014 family protein [Microscilla marina]|nr:hypothetical protein [Microscilla marina]
MQLYTRELHLVNIRQAYNQYSNTTMKLLQIYCQSIKPLLWLVVVSLGLSSCMSYYQTRYAFHKNFENGNLPAAEQALLKDKKGPRRNTKLLYYLNLGTVNSIMGNYARSNEYFEQAHRIGENYRVNYLKEAASFLVNPMVTEYKGEDFELLMIHYYKALNFLKMGDKEAALVECKRMNIKLNALGTKYKNIEGKYHKDAFVHNLMGIIYEANHDYNNAFIAYRNAVNIYQGTYKKMFGLGVPDQLKKDIIRAAHLTGFKEEKARYEEMFGQRYQPLPKGGGDLVFFWHNGLGPIKAEWSINFNILRGEGGNVTFKNDQYGWSFPFFVDNDRYQNSGLEQMEFIRVTFPKYILRSPLYQGATLHWNNQTFSLEQAENVSKLALKSLEQRMLYEVGKSLLRLALKKGSEYALRHQDKNAGAAILSAFNAVTEKADTRAWQSVPHSIYYTRIHLPEGKQSIKFTPQSSSQSKAYNFSFDIKRGQTYFHTFHSLDTQPGGMASGVR